MLHEAQRKIPQKYKDEGVTFFSDWDLWRFHHSRDDIVCNICRGHENLLQIIGSKVRLMFPYLEVEGESEMLPMLHPHCRCWLERVSPIRMVGKEDE